jgi:two-component system, LuxR family, response regulator FixJ
MSRGRVVFVDDEPRVCSAVSTTLERVGLAVRCFQNASECLDHLTAESCDLLVTDVRMPEMDGMDLLQEIRKRMPWLPVLLVTGYGDVSMAVRAMKGGAADFIEKPLKRDTFLHAVQSVLAKNAGLAALKERGLTKAEMKILHLILEGKNNRDMAVILHRSQRTIEVHRGHLMQKLGVTNIIELLRRATEMGLLQPNPPDTDRSPSQ